MNEYNAGLHIPVTPLPAVPKREIGAAKAELVQAATSAQESADVFENIARALERGQQKKLLTLCQQALDEGHEPGDILSKGMIIGMNRLGEAFSADEQVVLLIDEVDKADLEFPNDLLWELDKMEFYIPETKETIKAKHRPIVIITSNAEKELPDAFLRRCIFHYIEFPDQQQMEKIIRVHFDHVDETLLMQAMQAFYYIRSIDSVEKKPSTSELVDWIRALELTGVDTSRITKEIPFIGVLLKKDKDISTVQRRLRR